LLWFRETGSSQSWPKSGRARWAGELGRMAIRPYNLYLTVVGESVQSEADASPRSYAFPMAARRVHGTRVQPLLGDELAVAVAKQPNSSSTLANGYGFPWLVFFTPRRRFALDGSRFFW
jgi:hypothetical protein